MICAVLSLGYLAIGLYDMNQRVIVWRAGDDTRIAAFQVFGLTLFCAALWPVRWWRERRS
ncbi:hypothetical protein KUV46_15835 [Thalassovita mediterranea]|nr:hypothetical protein KUV46_15835 [Thalassovita mediterranea]